jgi:hypothetical protein
MLRSFQPQPRRFGLALDPNAVVAAVVLACVGAGAAVARAQDEEPAVSPPRLLTPAELEWPREQPPPTAPIEVLLTVDTNGLAQAVELPVSYGQAADDAIRATASHLKFEPATKSGEPVAARIRLQFEMPPAPEPEAPPEAQETSPASASPEPPTAPAPSAARRPPSAAAASALDDESAAFGARARVDKPQAGAASRVKLRGKELTMVPGTFGEPLRVVATLPGVLRSPFGLGFFLVRGASFQNTGFFVDGFAVPLLYHLGAGPAILSSRLVDQLDFYPGGFPVRFGQYSAGIISLRTAPPPADRLQLEAEVDLLRASALAIIPFDEGKGSVALAFRRSYYELLLPLITDAVSLAYTDYQLRLDYKLTPRLTFSLFFFGSRDRLRAAQDLGAGSTTGNASQGFDYAFDQLIVSADWQPVSALRVRWSGTIGPSAIGLIGQSTGDSTLGTDTHATRLGERLEFILTETPNLVTTLGSEISVFLYRFTGSAPSFGELPAIPAPSSDGQALRFSDELLQLVMAPYLEQVWRVGPLELSGGLRANYFRYGDVSKWVFDPRTVVRLKLFDGVKLKAATGLFSEPPLPFQLTRRVANPALLPQRAWQSSFGTELQLPAAFEVDSTVFYSQMWNITRSSGQLQQDEDGNVERPFFQSDGEGRAYGFELLLRRRADKGLFGWISYTLSRSERFLEGGRSVVFAFDQTHVLNVALSYAVSGWTFGGRFTLATGRPVGDILDPSGRTNFDADEDDFDPDSRGKTTRLPTFHQLDVRIDRDFVVGRVRGSVFLDVINLYNAQNSEGYRYSFDFTRRGRLPGLPILPTIGVRAMFE